LYVHGISDWEPWDPANVKWLSEAEIPNQGTGASEQKIRSRKELAAVLNASKTAMHPTTAWVHETLLADVRGPWEFRLNTVEAFGRNILLFKNLRRRMLAAHIQEDQTLRATIEGWKASVETYQDELRRDPHSEFHAPMETTLFPQEPSHIDGPPCHKTI
jgi:hypothetical protein